MLCRRPYGRLAVVLSVSGVGQACVWQCTRSTFIPCRVQRLPSRLMRLRARFHARVAQPHWEFLSRRLQTRDSCSLGLDSAGPEMSEKASFGKEHRVLQFILLSTNRIISPKAAIVARLSSVCSLPQFAGEGKKIGRQGTMSASQRRQAGAGASECMCAAASVRGTCGHRYI